METKDWLTFAISTTALAVSIVSLYLNRRKDAEGRHLEFVRRRADVLGLLEATQMAMEEVNKGVTRLREKIRRKEFGPAKSVLIKSIGEVEETNKRIIIRIATAIKTLSEKSPNDSISHKERILIEDLLGKCESIRNDAERLMLFSDNIGKEIDKESEA